VVLIFSDGVVEATSPDGAAYGLDGLTALLAQGTRSAADLVTRVLADLTALQGAGEQYDDVTLVALQVADSNEEGLDDDTN
jgi:serine phosphatase RsbU (regulator of sigma subunit)